MVTERERKEISKQGTWSPCSSPSTPSSSSFSRPPWPQRWPSQKISRNIFKVSWKRRPYRTSLGEKCFTGKLKIFVCCKWKGRGVLMSCSIFLLLVFHFLYAIPSQQSQERGIKIYLSSSILFFCFILLASCMCGEDATTGSSEKLARLLLPGHFWTAALYTTFTLPPSLCTHPPRDRFRWPNIHHAGKHTHLKSVHIETGSVSVLTLLLGLVPSAMDLSNQWWIQWLPCDVCLSFLFAFWK